ncbi:MAG TPA: DinB family protein [Pyrinomonadaceae bacterium]|nr:DinB family protein [Pyrinomonadaceae bacterium]
MLIGILGELYRRDLSKLKDEIGLYADDDDLWRVEGDISNSAGNLSLHISGNLQHFFGAVLGDSGYVRDRDGEFTRKGVSRTELLSEVDAALDDVIETLAGLTDEDLESIYPIEVFGSPMKTGFFLTHLATHLNWHLGQINYHRRLVAAKRDHVGSTP